MRFNRPYLYLKAGSDINATWHGGISIFRADRLPPCSAQSFSRSIVFLLDRSGSMTGKPLQYARQALDRALTDLGPNDQLNIIAYDHEQVMPWIHFSGIPHCTVCSVCGHADSLL